MTVPRSRTPKPAPAAKAPRRAAAKKAAAPKPYHHGALPEALLAAAEAVLVRDGLAGLGLRAIAREAGVSHTAPKHHFGDTTGLLSELAAVGFRPAARRHAGGAGAARRARCARPAQRDRPRLCALRAPATRRCSA